MAWTMVERLSSVSTMSAGSTLNGDTDIGTGECGDVVGSSVHAGTDKGVCVWHFPFWEKPRILTLSSLF
jgi:hypothetical protein